jgi:hypothetical protein
MTIGELLDAAKRKQGSLGAVADHFGFAQSRLSAWRSGARKPDAGEILVLAELAGLPPFETLAEIEQTLDSKNASAWARALGNLRAAGVAASVTLVLGTCLTTANEAKAAGVTTANAQSDGFEMHPLRQENELFRFGRLVRNCSQRNVRFCGRI